ncbi:NAD/NADP-dependent octopine/nopaline dehydrogenase family protein [Bradyrhizobium sp. SZCCHNS3002]|uniref:NAD/NADP-dependent octopine/nopaline dehydrogenase family protein n=1 Tax=Bradyrhizobium sp. SZCCHNS3002 TaxID=3057310 RepID=UPI0028EA1B9C|nr:NAD/NADP octopine/nopaline dehydrogenase family protein [Bradyrhizobium sp. SZCCHNS3002]
MQTSVSIIGAGNCGCAFAADLASRGANVLLYAHPEHRRHAETIDRNGYLEAGLKIEGRFHPDVSSDIADVVRFSKFIIITVPSYGHEAVLSELAKFDLSKHVVISITGNFFALMARRQINARYILETATAPYASRMQDGKVTVMGIKSIMPIAAMPVDVSEALRDEIGAIFPMPLEWRSNVLEIGMSCITGVIHPTPALMNAGWIETRRGDFYFYREGMSTSVARVIDEVDKERMAIAREFGFKPQPVVAIMNSYYDRAFTSFGEFARETVEHNTTKMAPQHMRDRFIVQDVPYVLVPWFELGVKVGLHSTAIKSIIDLASIVNETDYLETGRNLRRLGLDAASKGQVIETFSAPLAPWDDELRRIA